MLDFNSKETWFDASKVGVVVAAVLGEEGVEFLRNEVNEKGKKGVALGITPEAYEKAAGWEKYILEESEKIKPDKKERDLINQAKIAAIGPSIMPEKGRSGYRPKVFITHEEFAVITAAARGVKGAKLLEKDSSGEKVKYGVDRRIWAMLIGTVEYYASKAKAGDGFARRVYHAVEYIKEQSYKYNRRDEGLCL